MLSFTEYMRTAAFRQDVEKDIAVERVGYSR